MKKVFDSNSIRFKHLLEFTSLFPSQGFTYCHYTPDEAVQIIGKCENCLGQSLTVDQIWGSILKDFLIESDYTAPDKVLPLCSFPYNPLTLIYDQGMACPFQLFMVPYHFSIQPGESPTLKQWKRLSRIWVGNLWKSCQRQSTTRPQKKVTLFLAHYLPYLHYPLCKSRCTFLLYILLHGCNRSWRPWGNNATGWDWDPSSDGKIPRTYPARNTENCCRELPTGVTPWTRSQGSADRGNYSYTIMVLVLTLDGGIPSLVLIRFPPLYLSHCLTGHETLLIWLGKMSVALAGSDTGCLMDML